MRNYSQRQIRDFMDRIQTQLYRLNYKALTVVCNRYFPSIPIMVVDFDNSNFFFKRNNEMSGINMVFRARLNDVNNKIPYRTLSEISYIPSDHKYLITQFGRVNKPNEPMFYGSFIFPSACAEAISKGNIIKRQESAMFTVGVWKFETPLKLAQIPYSEKFFESFYEMAEFKSNSIQLHHITEMNENIRKNLKNDFGFEQLMFFADQFAKWDVKNDFEYMLSNYYADRVFNRIPELPVSEDIDGILYPSISNSYQELNVVLKPKVVDTKMKFLHAMQVWMVLPEEPSGDTQFIPLEQGVQVDENNKLLWKGWKQQ